MKEFIMPDSLLQQPTQTDQGAMPPVQDSMQALLQNIVMMTSSLAPEELQIVTNSVTPELANVLSKVLGPEIVGTILQSLPPEIQQDLIAKQQQAQSQAQPPGDPGGGGMPNVPLAQPTDPTAIPPNVRQDVSQARQNVPIPPSIVDLRGGNLPPAQ